MNLSAYFKQKKNEAACFRNDEHPDYYEKDDEETVNNLPEDDQDFDTNCAEVLD